MLSAPAADFDLVMDVHKGHVSAMVRAISINPRVIESILQEIRQTLAGERLGHLLLEFELAHALGESEMFEIMQTFSSVMPGLKIAVMNRDSRQHSSLQFGVQVSQEFGQDYRYFTDAEAADKWLAEQT
ncbi:MAG: hypothetical protein ACJ73D_02355 [Pyrinomonadaceae bacterium]